MIGLIILIILAAIAVYLWSIYNRMVTLKTRITASIQEIGNQLKRQSSLIPNIDALKSAGIKQETEIYKQITSARKGIEEATKSGDVEKMAGAGQKIQDFVSGLKVIVESNPTTFASAGLTTSTMNELRDTADKVMYSRRTLIDLTADYNTLLVTFPSNLVANMFGFKPEKGLATPTEGAHLTVSEEETKDYKVKP